MSFWEIAGPILVIALGLGGIFAAQRPRPSAAPPIPLFRLLRSLPERQWRMVSTINGVVVSGLGVLVLFINAGKI